MIKIRKLFKLVFIFSKAIIKLATPSTIYQPFKLNPMVTEAQHHALIDECKQWYDVLASYRKKINGLKNELYYPSLRTLLTGQPGFSLKRSGEI